MRGFVAVEAGSEVSARLSELAMEMKREIGTTRATYPREFHITLKFLGEFDESVLLEKIKEVIDSSCLGTKRFSLDVRGLGCFPSPKSPRVVFAPAAGDSPLAGLAARLDDGMEKLGFERENRRFSAHITLARLKEHSINVSGFLEKYGDFYFGSMPVNAVKLKKSTLTPQGPIYEDVYSAGLLVGGP